jgi:hypothetical protein
MESKQNKRQTPRVPVQIDAQFSVLIPEATFQPLKYPCTVFDLSERGALVGLKLDNDTYRMLLQKTRFCRLNFPAGSGLPERVIGRSVWIQPEGSVETRSYKIGLFFEDCPTPIMEQLREYLQRALAQAGAAS